MTNPKTFSWPPELPATLRAVARDSWLGPTLVATTAKGLHTVVLGDEAALALDALRARAPAALDGGPAGLAEEVLHMIEACDVAPGLPLDLGGTPFQRRVWQALREIPRGTTVSYSVLAVKSEAPRAVRAVGSACGANPVAIVVPCHRVVREDGSLGGYRWGLERKRALLAREHALPQDVLAPRQSAP